MTEEATLTKTEGLVLEEDGRQQPDAWPPSKAKAKRSASEADSRRWALIAAQAAADKKAADIVVLRVAEQLVITDYFVIASGANSRQLDAIVDNVEEALRLQAGLKPIGREGMTAKDWVLLDYGDIVVHVFLPPTRDFYRLETILNDAEFLDLAAEGIA